MNTAKSSKHLYLRISNVFKTAFRLTKNMYMLPLSYENIISEGCVNVQNVQSFKCLKNITREC